MLGTEHGHGANDVGAAILGQSSGNDFQGGGDLSVRQLGDALDVVRLLLQLVAHLHLDGAAAGNEEGVETDVSGDVNRVLLKKQFIDIVLLIPLSRCQVWSRQEPVSTQDCKQDKQNLPKMVENLNYPNVFSTFNRFLLYLEVPLDLVEDVLGGSTKENGAGLRVLAVLDEGEVLVTDLANLQI